ncbi:MAG: uracil-DNA glycosylase [Limnohabitans sp.]
MSVQLDQRQRAMLAEMGVRVWSPVEETQVSEVLSASSVALTQTHASGHAAAPAKQTVSSPAAPHVPASVAPTITAPVVRPATPILVQRPEGIDQMDWPTLQHTVSQCQACSLCGTRHNTVFGVGAKAEPAQVPQVDWLIVGEAPGENEDLQGEPFVGQAGQLLDNILSAMGLSRQGREQSAGVYITNVLKCRPPGNRNPKPDEVAQCLPYLERQVALLQPKIILAMGRFAVQALLRDSLPDVETIPLGKLRGQVHSYQGVPVVVTYHPAYVLRNLPEKAKVWADVCLAMAKMQTQSPR